MTKQAALNNVGHLKCVNPGCIRPATTEAVCIDFPNEPYVFCDECMEASTEGPLFLVRPYKR